MKIMITGGMGFVGSHLCEQFLKEKHNVIILTKSFIKKQNIHHISKKIKVEKIDVTNFKKLFVRTITSCFSFKNCSHK